MALTIQGIALIGPKLLDVCMEYSNLAQNSNKLVWSIQKESTKRLGAPLHTWTNKSEECVFSQNWSSFKGNITSPQESLELYSISPSRLICVHREKCTSREINQ